MHTCARVPSRIKFRSASYNGCPPNPGSRTFSDAAEEQLCVWLKSRPGGRVDADRRARADRLNADSAALEAEMFGEAVSFRAGAEIDPVAVRTGFHFHEGQPQRSHVRLQQHGLQGAAALRRRLRGGGRAL